MAAINLCQRTKHTAYQQQQLQPHSADSLDSPLLCASVSLSSPAQVKLDLFGDIALMPEGGYFVGQLNEAGRPHGSGSSFHRDGSAQATLRIDEEDPRNNGRWIDGGLYGLASQRFIDGDLFTGSFHDGFFSGLGCFTWADSAHFEGQFSAGERNGFGVEWGSDGRMTQSGRWEKDQLVEWCAVPIECITQGKMLSKHGQSAAR